MALIKATSSITDLDEMPEKFRYIQLFLQSTLDVVNGRLTLAENHLIKTVGVAFSATDTDVSVNHGLGRAPRGYLVVSQTSAMIIYSGSVSATKTTISLRSNATGTAQIMFL